MLLTPSQAEEFFGQRYAREALDLDPKYQPAQIVLLSLMLERAFRPDLDQVLLKPMPSKLQQLLATIDTDLLLLVLERGLNEGNVSIILASVQALGEPRRDTCRAIGGERHLPQGVAARPLLSGSPGAVRRGQGHVANAFQAGPGCLGAHGGYSQRFPRRQCQSQSAAGLCSLPTKLPKHARPSRKSVSIRSS